MSLIPYSCQTIEEDDIAAVAHAMREPYLTQGATIGKFEGSLAAYVGASYATACSSATAGLALAYRAFGVGPNSSVWTVPNSFVATANAALYCGARVDFVDIEPGTWNICVRALRTKLIQARSDGKLPHLVVPVHFGGVSCDMKSIAKLAGEFGFKVIEDAAHALGSTFEGKQVGNCEYSDAAVFSFHPVKTITTGEGGMIVTKDARADGVMKVLRTHGITREASALENSSEGAWYYEQQALGWHFRLTDIQAALGTSQLRKIGDFVARRRNICRRYASEFSSLPIAVPSEASISQSACHLFPVYLGKFSPQRKRVFDELRVAGIGVNVHYIPIHLQPFYRNLGFTPGSYPQAEKYYVGALSLPVFPRLEPQQQTHVIETLRTSLSQL